MNKIKTNLGMKVLEMIDLSIIIVNYNTKKLLADTIQSVIDTVGLIKYEIIVVDNASADGSIEMVNAQYPQANLIENKDNLGFPKANNIGIKEASGRYILLLNSDTKVLNSCVQKCLEYMDSNIKVGALGCKLLLANGKLDHACKRGFPTPEASLYYILNLHKLFPTSKKFGEYTLNYLPIDEINEVDALTGAFMMVRKEVINKVGLLDETFFMYGEDLDWCFRIKEAGYKVIYYPEAVTIHYKGGSSKRKRYKTIYEFHRAMFIFYNKHYRNKYNFIITGIVFCAIAVKMTVAFIINFFKL
ncbi:glycosyltransferase family 2 protein [Clostridium sp. CF012]|uniref:glycosyltransferase family 2 protein n=1 Tax=Clostridium sp. CF012 TaxID=2843319 RepID=UPI00209BAD02|nr:glycosyltransferase family 2 protein [Clostridium sp. CF012]